MNNTHSLARALIWLNIPVYLAIGLTAVLFPHWLAAHLDIELTSATAVADFSAMYGGLSLAAGFVMWLGQRRAEWLSPTVAMTGLFAAELAVGRVYAWLTAGTPSAVVLVALGTELAALAGAVVVFRALAAARPARPDPDTGTLHAAPGR